MSRSLSQETSRSRSNTPAKSTPTTSAAARPPSSRRRCAPTRPAWPCWPAATAATTGRPRAASWPTSPPACWWRIWATTRRAGGSACSSYLGLDAIAARRPGEFFSAVDAHGLQRPDAARGRGLASGWSPACTASRAARGCEQVMWAATGSEAMQKAHLGGARSPAGRRHHPRHPPRLPRQEGPGRRRHRQRERPRARSARALHQLSDATSATTSRAAASRSI